MADWVVEIMSFGDEEEIPFLEHSPVEAISPRANWSIGDDQPKILVCPVCKFSDTSKQYTKLEKCMHVMHKECVPTNRKCPMCREISQHDIDLLLEFEDPVITKVKTESKSTQTSAQLVSSQVAASSQSTSFAEKGTQTTFSHKTKIRNKARKSYPAITFEEDSWSSDSDFEIRKPPKRKFK